MNLIQYLIQGGPLMFALLALSVAATAIVIAKFYQFSRTNLNELDSLQQVLSLARAEKITEAQKLLAQSNSPVARVAEAAIGAVFTPGLAIDNIEAEIKRVGSEELRNLESWLRALSSIAQLSPFVGLLGTIFGMIEAFRALEQASKVNPALLAGGIWQALLTTAFGLLIAIPALAFYQYFEGRVDNVKALMSDAATRVLVAFGPRAKISGVGTRVSEQYQDQQLQELGQ